MSKTAKRLTQWYTEDILAFFEGKCVHTVPHEEFRDWLVRQEKYLQRNGIDSSSAGKKKEFFFIGEPGVGDYFNVTGVAVVKFPSASLAQTKCILVDRDEEHHRGDARSLLRVIEKYCSENSFANLEIFTNERDDTTHLGRDHSAYQLAYFIKSFNGIDEFVYRRKLVPDYLGDPTNWRDLALWFLDTQFSEVFPVPTRGDGPAHTGAGHSFRDVSYGYLCGPLKADEYPYRIAFNLVGLAETSIREPDVFFRASVVVVNREVDDVEVAELAASAEHVDICFLFVHECRGQRDHPGIRVTTWSDVFERILWVRQQNYAIAMTAQVE